MHPDIQQILVRDHIRSLHDEARANRVAAAGRSSQPTPPRSPLAAFFGPLVRAGRLVGRSAAG